MASLWCQVVLPTTDGGFGDSKKQQGIILISLGCTGQSLPLASGVALSAVICRARCSAGIHGTKAAQPVPVAFSLVFLGQLSEAPSSEDGKEDKRAGRGFLGCCLAYMCFLMS